MLNWWNYLCTKSVRKYHYILVKYSYLRLENVQYHQRILRFKLFNTKTNTKFVLLLLVNGPFTSITGSTIYWIQTMKWICDDWNECMWEEKKDIFNPRNIMNLSLSYTILNCIRTNSFIYFLINDLPKGRM